MEYYYKLLSFHWHTIIDADWRYKGNAYLKPTAEENRNAQFERLSPLGSRAIFTYSTYAC